MQKIHFEFYDWREFKQFLDSLSDKDAGKLVSTIQKIREKGIQTAERQEWIKKLDKNIYEIRSKRGSNIQRAIYFHYDGSKYVITNGFTKKTQKTPHKEIAKAKQRRQTYRNLHN